MDQHSVTLRAANPTFDEGLAFARYADEVAEGFFRLMLGRRADQILAAAFAQPDHDLSYQRVTFAERDNVIVGMVLGYTAKGTPSPLQPSDGLILVSGLRSEGHSVIFLAIQTHLTCRFLLAVDWSGKQTLSVTCLAEIAWIGYRAEMSVPLHKIARYVAQKAASDPEAREKAVKVARDVVDEAKQIAKEDDRAYAAGRAVRRALDKLQNNK